MNANLQLVMGRVPEFLETIATFPLSDGEIRVSCMRVGRLVYADIRVWRGAPPEPSKFGAWLPLQYTEQLGKAIERAGRRCHYYLTDRGQK